MSRTYVIQWKSLVNGRSGRGAKLFDRQEAEDLAGELNREFPQIRHEAVKSSSEPQIPEASPDTVPELSVK